MCHPPRPFCPHPILSSLLCRPRQHLTTLWHIAQPNEPVPTPQPLVQLRLSSPQFGINQELAHGKIRQMSGGQRQRLVLAAAFWTKPHLISLDEPTNYLDNDTLAALTQALKNFKGAVVTISHNQNFVAEISNEKWVVEDGQISVVQLRDAKAR